MKFEPALISIGLPVVKTQFLNKAMESCLQQSYKNIEIIIQNNAGNKQVKEQIKCIVQSFNDDRIQYFETESQIQMVQNWNEILKKVKGEFFAILCDDDKWHPDFIKEMHSLSERYPATNIYHSRIVTIDENDNELMLSPLCPEHEDGLDFIYHRIAGLRLMYLSDFMVRTSSLKEIGGFVDLPDGWGSDDITWFKIAMDGGVNYSPKGLFYYRYSHLNTTNKNDVGNKLLAIDYQYNEIQNIVSNHKRNNPLKIRMIENKLLRFKDTRKYAFWVKEAQFKYRFPYILARLIASGKRYLAVRHLYSKSSEIL